MDAQINWGKSKLGQEFGFDWDGVQGRYRFDRLDGTCETGQSVMDLRIWWGGDEIRLDRPDGWKTNITINGEQLRHRDLPRDQQVRLVDWELWMIEQYLQATGADRGLIERYWWQQGVLVQKGELAPERECPREEI
jgi:hypothetical protein